MKLVILEPLGVEKEKLLSMAQKTTNGTLEIEYYSTRAEDPDTLIERSKDADVVVLTNFQYRKNIIEHCPKLKMICVAFTGVDHVDTAYCQERGITVCNCAGYSTVAVSELVFGMLIDLYRHIIDCNQAVRSGGTINGMTGIEIQGKTFGVIGTGAIGLRVAAIAQALGCNILAYSRTQKPQTGYTYVDLNTLLEQSDIVSLHIPYTAKTKGLIGTDELNRMKSNAILINAARGPIVDYEALSQALINKKIAGAGIDVFEMEPPIPRGHPIFKAPNVIATPHIGFATKESFEKRAVIVFQNIAAWLNGKPQNIIV